MTDRDSTQSAPLVSPHYKFLSHPLVHDPHSYSYLECLDILENAKNLLDLFQHLDIDQDGEHGGLTTEATAAFFRQVAILQDTLTYVTRNLEDAWWQRGDTVAVNRIRGSEFFKALQKSKGDSQLVIYSALGITSTDLEKFIFMVEGRSAEAKDALV